MRSNLCYKATYGKGTAMMNVTIIVEANTATISNGKDTLKLMYDFNANTYNAVLLNGDTCIVAQYEHPSSGDPDWMMLQGEGGNHIPLYDCLGMDETDSNEDIEDMMLRATYAILACMEKTK